MPLGTFVVVDSQPDLLEVVGATRSPGCLTSLLHGRQEQAHQNADDGNDDEKFNEGKAMFWPDFSSVFHNLL
jgi:hypothetical protein